MVLDTLAGYNEIFTYILPGETTNIYGDIDCVGSLVLNAMKILHYVPIIGQIAAGLMLASDIGDLKRLKGRGQEVRVKEILKMPFERAKFARMGIAAAGLGPLLLIVDLFSTLVIKPIYYCALGMHQRKVEQLRLEQPLD